MSFEIAKAGWLYRLSSVLRRWKKSWFVLYTDGVLKFFESPDSHVADEAYVIPTKCLLIKTGSQVSGVTPPQGLDASGLIMLVFVNDQTLTMCAESIDDMRAWQISVEQARVIRMSENPPPYTVISSSHGAPPPYSSQSVTIQGYPNQTYYGTHPPPYVVQQPGGANTIIYTDQQPYYYRRDYDGGDVAMGVVAGAALGSLMWGPLLWW